MLSYILLFSLITLVILGVIRASKQKHPGARKQREPFVGLAQNEIVAEIEMVGKPRVIRANKPIAVAPQRQLAVAHEFADDFINDEVDEIQGQPQDQSAALAEIASMDAPPLFATKAQPEEKPTPTNDDVFNDVIVLNVLADHAHPYRGYELLQALLAVGLRYGKWNIFHRHEEISGRGPIQFSLASIVEPGTFDLAKIGSFSTPGLTLFMRASGLANPAQAFELLLSAAQQLAEELGGRVCDEKRRSVTTDKITWWRSALA